MLLGLFVVCLVGGVVGYSGGPPPSACASMQPGPPHQPNSVSAADKNSPPFEVVGKAEKKGQVKVFLRSTQERHFRGFMLMAEVDGDRGHGYFVPSPESKAVSAAMDCSELPASCVDDESCQGVANALVHSSNEDKFSVTAIWTAPSAMTGKVTFVATFVGENDDDLGSTWWEGIRSSPVQM